MAIAYICNPDKMDGKLVVSSFSCAAETADMEFGWMRRHATDKGTHLGFHLIQARSVKMFRSSEFGKIDNRTVLILYLRHS